MKLLNEVNSYPPLLKKIKTPVETQIPLPLKFHLTFSPAKVMQRHTNKTHNVNHQKQLNGISLYLPLFKKNIKTPAGTTV